MCPNVKVYISILQATTATVMMNLLPLLGLTFRLHYAGSLAVRTRYPLARLCLGSVQSVRRRQKHSVFYSFSTGRNAVCLQHRQPDSDFAACCSWTQSNTFIISACHHAAANHTSQPSTQTQHPHTKTKKSVFYWLLVYWTTSTETRRASHFRSKHKSMTFCLWSVWLASLKVPCAKFDLMSDFDICKSFTYCTQIHC